MAVVRWLTLPILTVLLAGCAGKPYVPSQPSAAPFLDRAITQTRGALRVTAAVPDRDEVREVFGLRLWEKGIQPIWLEVENQGTQAARASLWSIDPDYFAPLEVVWMNRGGYDRPGRAAMERWFYETAMRRRIAPGDTRSGFVYTHLTPGTKAFNLDVLTGAGTQSFTFLVPLPGFTSDHMEVDLDNLYRPEELQRVEPGDQDGLRRVVEQLPSRSTDPSGTRQGDPFNVVLVASNLGLRRSLLRAGWDETAAGSPRTEVARSHRYLGRRPDGTFEKLRTDGGERMKLRLWLTPLRYGTRSVWLGQISRDMSEAARGASGFVADPNVDDTRNYLLQNLWYSQSLAEVALVSGVAAASADAPMASFSGASYVTDGRRLMALLSEHPLNMDEAVITHWEPQPP